MVTAVGGTHRTGIYSCLTSFYFDVKCWIPISFINIKNNEGFPVLILLVKDLNTD